MGAQLGTDGGFNDINMTPLIDIVLVVLIIMMVNIPIQVEQMGVKLPGPVENNPPPTEPNPDQLVVGVYEDGTMALNRRLMTEEVMMYELTRRLRPMAKKIVFIDAHPDLGYGDVVDTMDLIREAGAATVGLARMKEAGPAVATSVAPGAMPRGVTLGSPTVAGEMDEATADAAFRPLLPVAMACYEQRLAANPELTGRFVLQVAVGPNGEIMEHSVASSTIEDEALQECVSQKVPGLKYAALGEQKTAAVRYPLLFSPG